MIEENEDEFECQRPCDPNNPFDECSGYWGRIVSEGYWNQQCRKCTDRGWREIVK